MISATTFTNNHSYSNPPWSPIHSMPIPIQILLEILSIPCWAKGSPNLLTQLVFIALNMLLCKQTAKAARELMIREEKIWRNRISYKKLCLCENQDKSREDRREKREKIYNKISVYFEEIIIGDQGGAGVYGAQRSRRLGRERTGRQGAHRGVGAAAGRAAAPRWTHAEVGFFFILKK